MKNKLIVFAAFFGVEYLLRTFVSVYKYHTVGIVGELLPLAILTIGTIILLPEIKKQLTIQGAFLSFLPFAFLGYLLSYVVLFFQWYWIIAPDHKFDMSEGFTWSFLFFRIGTAVLLIFTVVLLPIIRMIRRRSGNTTDDFEE